MRTTLLTRNESFVIEDGFLTDLPPELDDAQRGPTYVIRTSRRLGNRIAAHDLWVTEVELEAGGRTWLEGRLAEVRTVLDRFSSRE